MNNHENKCVLKNVCRLAGSPKCSFHCPSYIAMHGASGVLGRVGAAKVPADYHLQTFANLPEIPVKLGKETLLVTEALAKYIASFDRQFERHLSPKDRIKNVYLHSKATGTGKTTTASALIHHYIIANYIGALKRGESPAQRPAYFVSVNNLQQLHNKAYSPASPKMREEYGDDLLREIELAKTTPFIVLDDLAVRKATQSFIGVLYDIADYRISNQLPTAITSNKSLAELKEFFYDEDPEGKVVDRFSDLCLPVHFEGKSARGMRR